MPEFKVSGTICVSHVSATWGGDPDAALDYVDRYHPQCRDGVNTTHTYTPSIFGIYYCTSRQC